VNFSEALDHLKRGRLITRSGWNGVDMFLYLVPGSAFNVNRPPLLGIYPKDHPIAYHGHIDMKTAQGYCVPWVASQTDLLADDWMIEVNGNWHSDYALPPLDAPQPRG